MAQPKEKQLSGGAKLKAAGRHAIMLGVTPDRLATLKAAAAAEMRPVSQFVAFRALRAANAITAGTPQAGFQ